MSKKSASSAIYCMGFLGALVYNIQYAVGIGQFFWGLIKSMFWPAFLIYEVLSKLQI